MFRLMLVLLPVIGTTIMGAAVIAVLAANMQATWQPIALAALAGFAVSIPICWFVSRQILAKTKAG